MGIYQFMKIYRCGAQEIIRFSQQHIKEFALLIANKFQWSLQYLHSKQMIRPKPKQVQEQTKKAPQISAGILRLQKDIKSFNDHVEVYKSFPQCSLQFPVEGSVNPLHIVVRPSRGYYHGAEITFTYEITDQYPSIAPVVLCKQRVFHPNIDKDKKVCLSLLKDKWIATNELPDVVFGLLQILEGLSLADIEKPLDGKAAQIMKEDEKKYQEIVKETLHGKMFDGEKFDNVWIK